MSSTDQRIQDLFDQHVAGSLSAGELQEFYTLLVEHPDALNGLAKDTGLNDYPLREGLNATEQALALEAIFAVQPPAAAPVQPSKTFTLRRWSAAAAVLIILGAGSYLLTLNNKNTMPVTETVTTADIDPGQEGAILTLGDGRQVILDSLKNGVIATENGATVILQDGQLAYTPADAASANTVFNTMSTPRGRQFNFRLPDGTGVWLNSASSIRYPTVFTGDKRRVDITGEAYFEVTPDTKMPFQVNVNGQTEIIVLGTAFNVNAYDNEPTINTTLIEGSIKLLSTSASSIILKPGQQAQCQSTGASRQPIAIEKADTDQVLAWKNGLFNFQGRKLEEVMRQLERWYDIEVVYEKYIPDISFEGEMSTDLSLQQILIILKRSDIHCQLKGRQLIVQP